MMFSRLMQLERVWILYIDRAVRDRAASPRPTLHVYGSSQTILHGGICR